MKRSSLDLDQLLDANAKVYVKNNALKASLLLVIEMKDGRGKTATLKVPPIDVPISISSQFSRDMIRESKDLRDMLHKGILVLVDPKEAEAVLATEDSKEQLKAFQLSVYADSAPKNSVRDTMEKLKHKSEVVAEVASADILKKKALAEQDDVNIRIKGVVASFQSNEKSSKETVSHLRRLKPMMTETDLTFLLSECKLDKAITEFAEGALAELSAAPEKPFQD